MRTRIFFWLVITSVIFRNACHAQELRLSGGFNYGTFSMRDMKAMQGDLKSQLTAVPVLVVDKFPGYFGYEGSAVYVNETSIGQGLEFGFNSTGGRISYADYSGRILVDQQLRSVKFGFTGFVILNTGDDYQENVSIDDYDDNVSNNAPWEFTFNASAGLLFTNLEISQRTEVYGKLEEYEAVRFASTNFYFSLGPGVALQSKRAFVGMKILYQIDGPGKLKFSSDSKSHLVDDEGKPIKAHWTGLRISLTVGMRTFIRH
jgi:hypothetical protein